MTTNQDYNPLELRRMDEETARNTLTVQQFETWEQVQALYEDVEDTEAEWETQADTVADVTVAADMERLGTRVDIFGNSLLVHADPEDPDLRDTIATLDEEYGDLNDEDEIADERIDEYAAVLLELLDLVLEKWGETEWAEIPAGERNAILDEVRAKWGLGGLTEAWGEIAAAIREDREEVVDRLEKFRDEERRGNR